LTKAVVAPEYAFESDHQKNRRNGKEGRRPGAHSGEQRQDPAALCWPHGSVEL